MNASMIVRGGMVVSQGIVTEADVLVTGETITAIGRNIPQNGAQIIDARGKLVLPGVIDAHVQFGIRYRDTIGMDDFQSGSRAAAAGGVTTIIDFAVPAKGSFPLEALQSRMRLAQGKISTDFALHQGLTDASEPFLEQIPEIVQQGIPSFKIYMTYSNRGRMISVGQLAEIMRRVRDAKGIVEVHAEDDSVIVHQTERLLAAGRRSARFFPESRPVVAEILAIQNAIELCEQTRCPLYVHHVSSARGAELVKTAKERGLPIFGETCPPYLELTSDVYDRDDGYLYIVNPPIRGPGDRDRLWNALREGTLDVLGTDHCCYSRDQKVRGKQDFDTAPAGFPGVETLLPFIYTRGVAQGKINLARLVEIVSANPARIFGLFPRKGVLAVGSDADMVIYDPSTETVFKAETSTMGTDFLPFENMRVKGRVCRTILRGASVFADGEFLQTDGGTFVRGKLEEPPRC